MKSLSKKQDTNKPSVYKLENELKKLRKVKKGKKEVGGDCFGTKRRRDRQREREREREREKLQILHNKRKTRHIDVNIIFFI